MTARPAKLAAETRERRLQHRRKLITVQLINSYLDQAHEKTGSDATTAREIGLTPQKLSDIRHGRRAITPMAAVKLSRLLKTNNFQELCNALSRSARSTKTRIFWLDFAAGTWPSRADIYDAWANDPKMKKYPFRG
jgi:plasmid maintenance system antidote protein VapI